MRLAFTAQGWQDYLWWQRQNRNVLKRINKLIDAALRDPQAGIGKPEHLKYMKRGVWSRRIDHEHRLVYLVEDEYLIVLQARYHYE